MTYDWDGRHSNRVRSAKLFVVVLFAATVGIFAMLASTARAETVEVKYRGPVDLAKFECQDTVSSLVNRVCYNAQHQYMLILLKATWYHYCEIDAGTVGQLLSAESKGKFYNARIKDSATGGKFGCRDKVVPEL